MLALLDDDLQTLPLLQIARRDSPSRHSNRAMTGSNSQANGDDSPHIGRLDFDANRGTVRSKASRDTGRSLLDEDVDFLEEVADAILDRDRQQMRREVIRTLSFVCAVLSW